MKLLAIVCFTGDSGLTDYSVALATAMSAHSPVELITGKRLLPRFSQLGFRTHLIFRRTRYYLVDFPIFIARILRDRPYCLLFQGPLKMPVLEGLAIKFFRQQMIFTALTIHDVLPHYPRIWSRLEFAWFYRQFDRIIVHSKGSHDAIRALGVKCPILVVPHGSYDHFRITGIQKAQARAQLEPLGVSDFVVLFFGHLEPRKGLMEFIELAKQMQCVPGIKFVIAGENGMNRHGKKYASAIAEAKLLRNVVLRDERVPFEDVEKYFAASDLVALPYHEGTTSGVLKLAIAFGVPVVATRVGDLSEQVPQGGGVLFDADDNLTANLRSAVETVRAQQSLFATAMQGAAMSASWSTIAQAHHDFLRARDIAND